jgi:uncharacterized delta-60 repeat protein
VTPNRLRSVALRTVALLALGAWCGLAYSGIGDFDPTYGVDGRFGGYPSSLSVALLADGGAVSAAYSGGTLSIKLVDSNGVPDTHFGPAGERLIPLGLGTGRDSGAIELPGGDVLVTLHALPQGTTTGTSDAYLVRVSPDGTLNRSFGINGVWRMAGSGQWGTMVPALQAQPDGKILVALASFDYIYDCAKTMQLRRLLPDGSADLQFGTQGDVTLSAECYSYSDFQLSPLPGGFIAVGNSYASSQEQLLNSSGTIIKAPTVDLQNRLASFQSGMVIPGAPLGYIAGPGLDPHELSIARLRSDLTPDTSFGSQGTGTVTLTVDPNLLPQSLAPGSSVSANGQHIYGIATSTVPASGQAAAPALFRLNDDGTIDQQFGAAGIVRLNSFGPISNITDMLEQPSGAVLLSIRMVGVVRLLGGGAPSPGVIGFGPTTSADSMVAQDATAVTLTVVRSIGSYGAVNVHFHTEDSAELAGRDYQSTNGTLEWADGDESDRTITVQLLKNSAVVGTAAFSVVLDSPQGGAIIGSTSAGIYVTPVGASTPPPTASVPPSTNADASNASAGGGGGGAVSLYAVLVLLTFVSWKLCRRQQGQSASPTGQAG